MRGILERLISIEEANKVAKKHALFGEYLRESDSLFKDVVILALSETMHFNIKTLPIVSEKDKLSLSREDTLLELFKHLKYLASVSGAKAKDKLWIAQLASNLDCGTIIVKRILTGKLKCGITAKSANKVWPNLIFSVPYQRCSSESHINKINYPAYFDEKLDGMFFNIINENGKDIKYLSRNGKDYHLKNEKLDNAFINRSNGFSVVYTGEGRIFRNGKFLDRKTGNGIITKILKGTAKPEDHRDVVMTIWEALPLVDYWKGRCDVPLKKRYNSKYFQGLTPEKGIIRVPFRTVVNSKDEALDLANEYIENGGEGGVLKNLDSIWKDGTSGDWIKLKAVVDIELVVVGWEHGTVGDKYENCMGKVLYQSSDGMIKVRVGGGFSDEQRLLDWDMRMGCVDTIRFSEMIKSKTKVSNSLFLPRFVEPRPDKNEADNFETIVRLIKEAKKKKNDKK